MAGKQRNARDGPAARVEVECLDMGDHRISREARVLDVDQTNVVSDVGEELNAVKRVDADPDALKRAAGLLGEREGALEVGRLTGVGGSEGHVNGIEGKKKVSEG